MKKVVVIAGRLLALASIAYLVVLLIRHVHDIPVFTWGLWSALTLFLSVTIVVVNTTVSSYAWSVLLRGGNVVLAWRRAFIIIGQSQIGKYLPGNVFQYVGRIALGRKSGIPAEPVLLSIGAETLLVASTAAAIAAVGLSFDRTTLAWLSTSVTGMSGRALVPLAVVLVFVILILIAFLHPVARSWVVRRLGYMRPDRAGISVLLYLAGFVMFGVLIALLLKALWGINEGTEWYQFTWGFALAWVIGFIVPGAPGGIGIREAVFVGLYGHELGQGLAIGLAAVLRVMTSVGDLVTFGLAYWLGRQEGCETSK